MNQLGVFRLIRSILIIELIGVATTTIFLVADSSLKYFLLDLPVLAIELVLYVVGVGCLIETIIRWLRHQDIDIQVIKLGIGIVLVPVAYWIVYLLTIARSPAG